MQEKEELLKKLRIEDFVWVIYLVIIGLSFYSNYVERKYIIYDDDKNKNKYRLINMTVFTLAVLIYIYFVYDNYKELKNLKEYDNYEKKKFTYIEFTGAVLALISGLLFLYSAIYDINLDTEIAFN